MKALKTPLAVKWFLAKQRSAQGGPFDRALYKKWLSESSDNALQIEELMLMDELLEQVADSDELAKFREELRATYHYHGDGAPSLPKRSRRKALTRWYAVAALVLLSIAVFGFGTFYRNDRVDAQTYVTARGEQKDTTLEDGSKIEINTASSLTVLYSKTARRIDLARGEAHFDVKSDADRPFEVAVGEVSIRVIGTRFNVHEYDGQVDVSVYEGHVSVKQSNTDKPHISLVEGELLHIDDDGKVTKNLDLQLKNKDAWRRGRLEFNATSLEDAVDEYNRYVAKPISLKASELPEKHISGVFDIGDAESFLAAIVYLFPLEVEDKGDRYVLRVLKNHD